MSKIPFNDENKAKVIALGESLLGTCHFVDRMLEEHFGEGVDLMDLDANLLHELDDIAEECQYCGWWCEPGEVTDGECVDCRH